MSFLFFAFSCLRLSLLVMPAGGVFRAPVREDPHCRDERKEKSPPAAMPQGGRKAFIPFLRKQW
ncbi:MAG: hypothetical protein IJF15_01370, partial [Oscillospiraceae bacterium]|nr:hypothetical protein [Oscillospiraceae bacterium]